MATEQFANLYSTTLASSYTAGAGSISVTSATGAPTTGTFTLVIRDSSTKAVILLFRVTSVSGTTFTGAAEGADTNAASSSLVDGTMVTVASLAQMRADISQYDTYANLPSSGMLKGDVYRCSDSIYDFWYSGAVWIPFVRGAIGSAAVIPPSGSWSWDNQGSATIDYSKGYGYLVAPTQGLDLRLQYRTAPSTPYTIDVLIDWEGTGLGCGGFLGFRQSGTGKLVGLLSVIDGGGQGLSADKWNSTTSYSGAYGSTGYKTAASVGAAPIARWLRIADDGTNLTFSWSNNGIEWVQHDQQTRTDFLTTTGPDQLCWGAYVNAGGDIHVRLYSWYVH
jgi:hypothetical protein